MCLSRSRRLVAFVALWRAVGRRASSWASRGKNPVIFRGKGGGHTVASDGDLVFGGDGPSLLAAESAASAAGEHTIFGFYSVDSFAASRPAAIAECSGTAGRIWELGLDREGRLIYAAGAPGGFAAQPIGALHPPETDAFFVLRRQARTARAWWNGVVDTGFRLAPALPDAAARVALGGSSGHEDGAATSFAGRIREFGYFSRAIADPEVDCSSRLALDANAPDALMGCRAAERSLRGGFRRSPFSGDRP